MCELPHFMFSMQNESCRQLSNFPAFSLLFIRRRGLIPSQLAFKLRQDKINEAGGNLLLIQRIYALQQLAVTTSE